jgi:hypothetical protein
MTYLRAVFEELPLSMRNFAATLHMGDEMVPLVHANPEDPTKPMEGAVVTQLMRDTDEAVLDIGDAPRGETRITRITVRVRSTGASIPLHYVLV